MSRRARVTNAPLPASLTKHVDELDHALPARKGDGCNLTLKQESKLDENMSSPCHSVHAATSVTARSSTRKAGSTGTTGTTLWLGAQIMSVYLETILPPSLVPILDSHSLSNANTNSSGLPCPDKRKRAIELGSGIGYLSLYLASKGYDVLATDIEPSLSSVLKPNIAQGLDAIKNQLASTRGTVRSMGDVIVSEIDWMNSPAIPTAAPGSNQRQGVDAEKTISEPEAVSKESMRYLRDLVGQGLDMIISTDTLYAPVIVEPLWNTIYHLSHISAAVRDSPAIADFPSPSHGGVPSKVDPAPLADTEITHALHAAKPVHPRVYIALENRDPNLISAALAHGTRLGFELRRVPQSKLSKALKDVNWSWDKGEWDGVEVWKGQWKGKLP